MIRLDRLPPGQFGFIAKLRGTIVKKYGRMGLIPGMKIYCRYRSPGGSVTVLEVGDRILAFRNRDLRHILVETL